MVEKYYLTVNEVAEYMGISVPTAYKIIRKLNNELAKAGYITVAGKINKRYFEKKTYGNVG